MSKRVIFYVDGFNLYHSICDASLKSIYKKKLKWLDLKSLLKLYLNNNETIEGIKYFSAYYTSDPIKQNRHKTYIKALESTGISVILGKFKEKDIYCKNCKTSFKSYEEKRTDVNIAINILYDAFKDNFDTAILVSGDTDLIPVLEILKKDFPLKLCGILFPYNRSNLELSNFGCFKNKIKIKDMENSLLPDQVLLKNGVTLTPPVNWT